VNIVDLCVESREQLTIGDIILHPSSRVYFEFSWLYSKDRFGKYETRVEETYIDGTAKARMILSGIISVAIAFGIVDVLSLLTTLGAIQRRHREGQLTGR
jgi:hypothetical protein